MHVEKPTSTSAASTAFCVDQLDGPGGHLYIDGNGKITAANGSMASPRPNAFSLVQVKDCPGATAACKAACYVHGLEQHAPDIHAAYRHNSDEIRRILASGAEDRWAGVMAKYIEANCFGGFRWHVSGDVFSMQYARFISRVCARSPLVRHWIYTRSLNFVSVLAGVSVPFGGNLALNVSADVDNYERARDVAWQYRARVCYMTRDGEVPSDLPDGSVIFPDYTLRGGNVAGRMWFEDLVPNYKSMVCPVDYHGKSEERRCGRCSRCMI